MRMAPALSGTVLAGTAEGLQVDSQTSSGTFRGSSHLTACVVPRSARWRGRAWRRLRGRWPWSSWPPRCRCADTAALKLGFKIAAFMAATLQVRAALMPSWRVKAGPHPRRKWKEGPK